MRYRHSELDKKNIASFSNDLTRKSLVRIALPVGAIRGLSDFQIKFSYPLSAIAGKNGSGKSTVLALSACAFHSGAKSWRHPGRSLPYYRFSDFFVQTGDDVPVEGVQIEYGILHDKWKVTDALPNGRGIGQQKRIKNKGGKWNDYSTRLSRPVAFFGIDRVVPPSEKGVLKNQRNYFAIAANKKTEIEEATRASVSKILGIDYQDFELRGYGSHKLPLVEIRTCKYSGFNMGAGEQALFSLFTIIHSAPKATLFVIDEIELGLHEAAQKTLIGELKQIAFTHGHQFIFTTHSPTVLESLPPEGRFFLSKSTTGTKVIEGISAAFAAGRMADKPNVELHVYVEDANAKQLVSCFLSAEQRRRIRVVEVGSNSAVISQMAAKFLDHAFDKAESVFILDGDQRSALLSHKSRFLGMVDQKKKSLASDWFDSKIGFLPSDLMPERYVISTIRDHYVSRFCDAFGIESKAEALEILDKALVRGEHSEIYWMSEDLVFPPDQIWKSMCDIIFLNEKSILKETIDLIDSNLP